MKAAVLEAIKKSAAVPSMPQVVARFLEIMQDPNYEYDDLVRAFSVDPGTVSEILRLANSALFGVRNKIVSLKQALTLLGPKRTRSLILGRYLVDSMSRQSITGLDMSYFWRRSLAASVIAARFADRVAPQHREETFLAALLADIGIPILAEALPDAYGPMVAQFAPRGARFNPDDEQATVGACHGEVSGIVLAHWRLPESICKAVILHQSSNPDANVSGAMARILNAADRIAKLLCEVTPQHDIVTECQQAAEFVGIDVMALVDLLPTIEQDVEELASVLRIDVIPSNVYALIAKCIRETSQTEAHA